MQQRWKDTHETQSFRLWVVRNVFCQVSAWHPIRDELEWIDGDTEKRDDIWVCQVFPRYSYLVEGLWDSSAPENEKHGPEHAPP